MLIYIGEDISFPLLIFDVSIEASFAESNLRGQNDYVVPIILIKTKYQTI